MRFTDGTFVSGTFVNDAKTSIEALFKHQDETIESTLVQVDIEDEVYKKLIADISLDSIAAATEQKHDTARAAMQAFLYQAAANAGMIYDPDESSREARAKLNADFFFTEPSDDFAKDLLFNIKIKCFEMEKVTSSTNRDLKKALRQAKTAFDVLYITGKLVNE